MFKKNFFLIIFAIYQFFSVLMIALGVIPNQVIWLNLVLQLAAVLFFDVEYGLLSIILSLPFYIALPLKMNDSFQSWRVVFVVYFAAFLWKEKIAGYLPDSGWFINRRMLKMQVWDKYLFWFAVIAAISAAVGSAPGLGIKKLLFVINIYFIYIAALQLWKTREQFTRALYALFAASATIVLAGYAQLVSTFFSSIYYFWQYWALRFAKTFYGTSFATTASYSNSWFAFDKTNTATLRMFSIMPDSHSFALVALFSIAFAIGVLYLSGKTWQKVALWIYIIFANLAIIFSGTKGVWVSIAVPLLFALGLSIKRYGRKVVQPVLVSCIIFAVLFGFSPYIQKGVNRIAAGHAENFIQRAENIYNLNESSNAGRIYIWKKVLAYSSKHFLLGAGYGNFSSIVAPYSSDISRIFNLPLNDITAHNLYLGFLAETGIIGLLLIVVYFLKIMLSFWGFFRSHYLYSEDPFPIFAVAMGFVFLALLTYSLVDETLYNDRILMLFFLSLALSAAIIREYV